MNAAFNDWICLMLLQSRNPKTHGGNCQKHPNNWDKAENTQIICSQGVNVLVWNNTTSGIALRRRLCEWRRRRW